MKKLVAFIRLSRPVNVFITMLAIFLAAVIAGPLEPLHYVLLACFAGGFIASAANAINDYYDVEIDRINKPYRPLPAGQLSPRFALLAAFLQFLIGIVLSMFLSLSMFIIALSVSILLYAYATYFKRTVLLGNFLVSIIGGMAFIYGATAVGKPREGIIPAMFALFFHLGREIIKDLQDVEGDAQNAVVTFPLKFGVTTTLVLVWITFIILMILTLIPFLNGWYGIRYFITVLIGIYPVIIFVLYSITRNTSPSHLGFLSNLLKADMFVGLLAIYLR